MPNRLINEKSPYLLSHAHNPIDWYPWGDEAFNKAKELDRPIFLSIGYSSCHWCHVMERESFMDSDVAKILNDNYIAIKVDREERPDVDNIYMDACIAINGTGGWPMSIFVNHDKIPFYAGTYFPKEDRMNIMGFMKLLERISNIWNNNRQELNKSGVSIINHINQQHIRSGGNYNDYDYDRLYQKIARGFDSDYGGFHNPPKFPNPQLLLTLMRYACINPSSYALRIVDKTLTSMANGGLFDHVGGGFFRYSTDRVWLVPHFEKMLYDNAMLMQVYAEAARAIDIKYKDIVDRIGRYIKREMTSANGGFFTAEDADSEGVEGKYYLFMPYEITSILGEDEGQRFNDDYNITSKGNYEGRNILNRIGKSMMPYDKRLDKVLEYRNMRVKPFKDDKITTAYNALMIASTAIAGRLLGDGSFIELAEGAAGFIENNLYVDGRLMARWREGEAKHPSTLDDYAYLMWGHLELFYSTYDYKWLDKCKMVSEDILRLFKDTSGGLFYSASDITDLPIRQKTYYDGALPSGNAVIARNMIRLSELTGDIKYKLVADEIMQEVYQSMIDNPYSYSGHLVAFMERDFGKALTIINGEGVEDMITAIDGYKPFIHITLLNKDSMHSDKQSIEGKATAYMCDKYGCKPPVTDRQELIKLMN